MGNIQRPVVKQALGGLQGTVMQPRAPGVCEPSQRGPQMLWHRSVIPLRSAQSVDPY